MTLAFTRHSDEDMQAAAAATDAHVASHPRVAQEIEDCWWAFHELEDVPPFTTDTWGSGNLTPIVEAENEVKTSITLVRFGLYKQAMTSLRSALELGLLAVYWDADDRAYADIREWLRGAQHTPMNKEVKRRLSSIPGVARYVERDPEFFGRVQGLFNGLGGYVHTRGLKHAARGIVKITNVPTFSAEPFDTWAKALHEVTRTVLAVHLLKYPLALQYTPLTDKFGMDRPMGYFVTPRTRDRFRSILTEEARDILQELSDADDDAVARAKWVNDQPDLTPEEHMEQLEQAEKEDIRHRGFENWDRDRAALYEAMPYEPTEEDLRSIVERRERLRAWAEQEGVLTFEDARETYRRSQEASGTKKD
ncbi:hypothetical protein [Microbacterium maritypicum]